MIQFFIDLRHLNAFLAAADHGSFRKAAARMKIRQSAVSRRICDLERLLGSPLVIRHAGGVRVTEAGQQLCCRIRNILHQLRIAIAEVAAMRSKDTAETELRTTCAGLASLTIALTACASCLAFNDPIRPREHDREADQPMLRSA